MKFMQKILTVHTLQHDFLSKNQTLHITLVLFFLIRNNSTSSTLALWRFVILKMFRFDSWLSLASVRIQLRAG